MNGNSTIEIGFIITVVLFAFSVWSNFRTMRQDNKREGEEKSTVLMKLEIIQSGINELKTDIKSVKDDIKEIDRRLTIEEQSMKARWKQIDAINKKGDKE